VRDLVAQVQTQAEPWPAEAVLDWALRTFRNRAAIASALGVEGMTLIDMASRLTPQPRVFILDTEFLFAETYDLIDRVERRYGLRVERVYSSLTPSEQERVYGAELWARDPDLCCKLRKVEPLKVRLAELGAWITAIRRDQTPARARAPKIEWDTNFRLVKVNPIADWTSEMVWNYVRKHDVPFNALHQKNYPSIGCTHCTRAVRPGEDARAGRWAGFAKTECGLHAADHPSMTAVLAIKSSVVCEEH
jgi:phosphoadenosine phosphosulfate reductase